jgi:hypothetical protein
MNQPILYLKPCQLHINLEWEREGKRARRMEAVLQDKSKTSSLAEKHYRNTLIKYQTRQGWTLSLYPCNTIWDTLTYAFSQTVCMHRYKFAVEMHRVFQIIFKNAKPIIFQVGHVANVCSPSTHELEAGGSWVWVLSRLARPCLKKTKTKMTNKNSHW